MKTIMTHGAPAQPKTFGKNTPESNWRTPSVQTKTSRIVDTPMAKKKPDFQSFTTDFQSSI